MRPVFPSSLPPRYKRIAGGGGGGIVPSDISGLRLWLDAGTLTLSDTDPVALWEDESGNGHDATQSSSSLRPTYHVNVVNGLPVVRFGVSSAQMALPSGVFTGLSQADLFIVLKVDNDPPGSDTLSGFLNWGTSGLSSHYPYTDGNIYDETFASTRHSTGNPFASLAAWHLYNVSSDASTWTSRINGVTHYTAGSSFAAPASGALIGKSQGSYELDGDLAEIIVYDSVLAGGDRSDLQDYVATKYGLTI